MLRNRQNTDEAKLVGVNLQADQSKLKLGSFTLLQNFVPAKRYKIKKKRGVVALTGNESIVFPTDCDGNETFLSVECGHECPITQFAEAEIQFSGGEAPGGPAIRVDPASTPEAFTGLAAIYYAAASKLALVRFDGAPLTDVDIIIDSIDTTLSNGDVLRIEAGTDPEEYSVLVNGVSVIGPETIVDADLSITNSCIGFVGLVEATIP